jgi:hypothetical protein
LRLPTFLADAVKPAPSQADVAVAAPARPEAPMPVPAEPPSRTVRRVSATAVQQAVKQVRADQAVYLHGPVEFERTVPASGNLEVLGKQFWLGPVRAGQVVAFWADTQVIHLCIGGARVKSLRSHLSVTDLAVLARLGARPAGPSPLPVSAADAPVAALEVDRTVGTAGWVAIGNHIIKATELRAGTRVGIRLDESTLSVFDLDSRELLRVGPNPLTPSELLRVRGARPAGPPPQPRTDPVRVQRRVSKTGGICVCTQKIALGREHARKTVTVHVGHDMLTIELDDGHRTIRRTTNTPVSNLKAQRPRKVSEI